MTRASHVAVLVVGTLFAAWVPRGPGFKGLALDEHAKPVANAWIEARKVHRGVLDASDFEGPPQVSMRTGADGAYAIQDLPPGLWLVTAVASNTARTDAEMQELARPNPTGLAPSGVAIARILNNFEGGRHQWLRTLNLRLASGTSADQALRCRLTGALAPDEFGYQVEVEPPYSGHSGSGQTSTSFNVDSDGVSFSWNTGGDVSEPTNFYAVPTADGRLDFGGLGISECGTVSVEAFSLTGATAGVRGCIFRGLFRDLQRQDGEYVIPLRAQKVVTLAARVDDKSASGTTVFTIWGEHGEELAYPTNDRPREADVLLTDETYVMRAMVGGWASPLTPVRVPSSDVLLTLETCVMRAMVGDWASPLTPVRVRSSDEPVVVTLPLQACRPFTLHLADQEGKPLSAYFMTLGVAGASELPEPYRVPLYCSDGQVEVSGILPGTYDVQFQHDVQPPFVQRIDIRPDAPTIEVTVPR